ncbi:MAG: hypothetical protein LBH96_06410 [Candidatus Peribacteria bacterium]|nr:hypothetical protein [Candidatus Peribacteria bacterium]
MERNIQVNYDEHEVQEYGDSLERTESNNPYTNKGKRKREKTIEETRTTRR